jgi:hypothetical protein
MLKQFDQDQERIEEIIRSEIDEDKLWSHVEYLCDIGEKFSGTKESKKAVDYFVSEVKKEGVPIDVYEFESYLSYPSHDRSKDASLKIIEPDEMDIQCQSHAMSGSTKFLEAELIDIGPGDEIDYKEKDVKGKIVLVDFAALWAPERLWIAQKKGAVGQITVSGDPVIHDMIVTTIWGTPTRESSKRIPKIPILSVTNKDGAKLREYCKKGRVKVSLKVDIWKGWKKIYLPVVSIPGSEDPEKYFLIHGHFCSWGDGMTDNVGGDAQFIEMAKIFWKHRDKLKRGVKIAWWPGHSHGRYSGSTWFVDQFWDDLNKNCIGQMNIDSPGVIGATEWRSYSSSDLKYFNQENMKEFSEKIIDDKIPVRNSTWVFRAGDQSFTGIGIPRLGCNTNIPEDSPLKGKTTGGGAGGWWWHTLQDTIDKGDKKMLPMPMKINMTSVTRLCNSTLLPYSFVPVAADYLESLKELSDISKNVFDMTHLLELASELYKKAEKLDDYLDNNKTIGAKNEETNTLNNKLMKIVRVLNSAYCVETDRFDQDPATRVPPLPKLYPIRELVELDQKTDEARFLKTGLVRRKNELYDAITRAIETIDTII